METDLGLGNGKKPFEKREVGRPVPILGTTGIRGMPDLANRIETMVDEGELGDKFWEGFRRRRA